MKETGWGGVFVVSTGSQEVSRSLPRLPLMWTSICPWTVLHPRGGRWLLTGSVPSGAEPWCAGPQVKVEQMALELRLTPLTVLLRSVLDQLQEKDPARIFAQPVSLKEVGILASCAVLLRACGDPGMWKDPSQCVCPRQRTWATPWSCVSMECACVCLYVHDACPGYVECKTLVVSVNGCFVP